MSIDFETISTTTQNTLKEAAARAYTNWARSYESSFSARYQPTRTASEERLRELDWTIQLVAAYAEVAAIPLVEAGIHITDTTSGAFPLAEAFLARYDRRFAGIA